MFQLQFNLVKAGEGNLFQWTYQIDLSLHLALVLS